MIKEAPVNDLVTDNDDDRDHKPDTPMGNKMSTQDVKDSTL